MSVAEIAVDAQEPSLSQFRFVSKGTRALQPLAPLERRRDRPVAPEAAPRRATPEFKAMAVALLPDLERWARHLTAQPSDAKDLVQDTYRRALEAHEQFRPGSDLRAWLGCILRNLHLDRMRRGGREISMGIDDGCSFAAPPVEMRPQWARVSDEDLQRALGDLPPVYRTPYLRHTVHGRSYSEIAQEMGLPSGTIGSRIHRARVLLRHFLLERLEAPATCP